MDSEEKCADTTVVLDSIADYASAKTEDEQPVYVKQLSYVP